MNVPYRRTARPTSEAVEPSPVVSLLNATAGFLPSSADLANVFPRLARRASSFASWYLPEQLNFLAPKTIINATNATISVSGNGSRSLLADITSATAAASTVTAHPGRYSTSSFLSSMSPMNIEKLSNLGGIFSYLVSRWAVTTFIVLLILNRAHVYASARRHLQLNWQARLALRIVPIAFFISEIIHITQAMRCQTSPYLQTGKLVESPAASTDTGLKLLAALNKMFTGEEGFLYKLSSRLLFWQSDEQACLASNMVALQKTKAGYQEVTGTSSILWPLFVKLCFSHFIETISCALQGRQPMAETGMTIFEHSLAFAEADAAVRGTIGLGPLGFPKASVTASKQSPSRPTATSSVKVTRSMILHRLNVPPEILLVTLLSSCSHLTSSCLAIFNLQNRFRLFSTGVWGICYMVAFSWSFARFAATAGDDAPNLLRYPTVCIVGFIPHLIIVAGICICGVIYVIALLLTAISPPPNSNVQGSIKQRLCVAHSNLQASASFSNIRLNWSDEFFTWLLKVGFSVLTGASEAVYFNEGTNVTIHSNTWLDEQRIEDVIRERDHSKRIQSAIPAELQGDASIAEGIGMVEEDSRSMLGPGIASGYARERKSIRKADKVGTAAIKEEGVGQTQRSGRWYMSGKLIAEVALLCVRCQARLVIAICRKIGFHRTPRWLETFAAYKTPKAAKTPANEQTESKTLEFWYISDDGSLQVAKDLRVDVEVETRKRLVRSDTSSAHLQGEVLDDNLYEWWKSLGWWGEADSSGSFQPPDHNDDLTSQISETASHTSDDRTSNDWSDAASDDSGQRTPTREDPYIRDIDDGLDRLSHLLDPKTLEDRQAARLLAHRLRIKGPLTRSKYNMRLSRERRRMLTDQYDGQPRKENMSPDEEEELLEQIILTRRQQKADHSSGKSWTDGAAGMGDAGPQCVVCHSSPRTILVWPCRCLSLCEDCRVSLAMNNFGNCVCCRRDVVAFSRLYVP